MIDSRQDINQEKVEEIEDQKLKNSEELSPAKKTAQLW